MRPRSLFHGAMIRLEIPSLQPFGISIRYSLPCCIEHMQVGAGALPGSGKLARLWDSWLSIHDHAMHLGSSSKLVDATVRQLVILRALFELRNSRLGV
jgi:hypothetical protein